jgi:hypothetical protein
MEKRWINKNVDLALLTSRIGDFFKERDFGAVKGETAAGYQIFAEGSPSFRLDGCVSVVVEGKPDDFIVKLELSKREKKSSFTPILLTTMFLGGYFLKSKLRSEEDWMRFEKEFWRYLDCLTLH